MTTTDTDPRTMTPAEIDTILAKLWEKQARAETDFRYWANRVRLLESGAVMAASSYSIAEARERRGIANEKALALEAEAEPYNVQFAVRPWNRYFLVTNSNGHVHRGMDCNTCFPTTQYAWLPELSDCDEGAMVEEFGEKACTICFPDAPSYPAFAGPGRRDAEAIAARQATKDARAAVKAAKALPGGRVRDAYGWVETKVAARNALSSAVNSYGWYGPSHSSDFLGVAKRMIEALADTEIDTAAVIERAAKKVAKEGGTHDIREAL